jgi:hypothetical protein
MQIRECLARVAGYPARVKKNPQQNDRGFLVGVH